MGAGVGSSSIRARGVSQGYGNDLPQGKEIKRLARGYSFPHYMSGAELLGYGEVVERRGNPLINTTGPWSECGPGALPE
jgi:hypothetical protein